MADIVGLVGTVFSFIDFASKLFINARDIYRSTSDLSPENSALDAIARDVEYHCNKLKKTSISSTQLDAITDEARKVAEDLQSKIQEVRKKIRESKSPKWVSFRIALSYVMKGNEISAMAERLSNINKQITDHLLQSTLAQQDQLIKKFDGMEIEIQDRNMHLETFIAMVREDLNKVAEVIKDREKEITSKLENKGGDAVTQGKAATSPDECSLLPSLDAQSDFISFYALQGDKDKIISHYQATKALEFNGIRLREGQIDTAHVKTFRWALDESQNGISFVRWLQNSKSTYWIQGKPGAGKSTLMKYICEQPKTYEHLELWAQGKSLVTAKYFSWFAGTSLQKSLEGLLRSLLFDIFTKRPLLIRDTKLLEDEEFKYSLRKGSYNTRILESLLQRLIKETPRIRYCLFIDGLDEFIEPHAELIAILNSLSENENVKLCVSSRPLPQFEDEYGERQENLLKVESLTRKDIESFVADKLNSNKPFRRNLEKNPLYGNLITQPVDRSSGVFLWVVLIVRSLLQGLTNGDSIEDLQQRLSEFPSELKESLVYILKSVDGRYHKGAAEAFRIALVYEDAVPLILYSTLFEMKSNIQWPIQLRCGEYSQARILEIHETAPRKLDTRCKGLLEVVGFAQALESYPTSTVHWSHRCIKEFVKSSEEVKGILGVGIKDGPNARLLICSAYLGVTKWLQDYEEDFEPIVFRPFCSIADKLYRLEPDPLGESATESDVQTLNDIICELEKTLHERWPSFCTRFAYRALELNWEKYIEYGMHESRSPVLTQVKGQLLEYALGGKGHNLNLPVLEILLRHHADPNAQLRQGKTQTPWITALTRYLWEKKGNKKKTGDNDIGKTVTAVQLLAEYGGDPDAGIPTNGYFTQPEEGITARDIIEDSINYPELQIVKFKPLSDENLGKNPNDNSSGRLSGWIDWLRSRRDWVIAITTRPRGRDE